MADGHPSRDVVGLLTEIPTTVHADDPLEFAGEQLAGASAAAVPVLDPDNPVVG